MENAPKVEIKEKQLNSINKVLSTLAFALISIIGLRYIAKDLLAPILLAIFLAVILYPLFKFFRRKGFSSRVSLVFMILSFFLGVGLIVIFLTWSFNLLAESLSTYVEGFKATFNQTASSVNINSETTQEIAKSISPQSVQLVIRTIINSFGNIVLYLLIIPFVSILMILQIDSFPKATSENVLRNNLTVQRFQKFAQSIILYIYSRLKVNVVTGVLFAIALILLGVPFPFVWGFLTIIMSFIPYIGLIIAGTPPVLLAFAQGGIVNAVLVIIAIAIINIFAENVLSPSIQGKDNKISTVTVVISFLFFTWLLGPIGAILSVPLTVFLKLVLEDFEETHFLALLMEGNYNIEAKGEGKSFYDKYIGKFIKTGPGKK